MKILHLATHEGTGAGRAALRLHQGLLQEKIDSSMLVSQKSSNDPLVVLLDRQKTFYKKLQAKIFGRTLGEKLAKNNTFSINLTPSLILSQIKSFRPDIINLHWIGWEFLKIEDLKSFKVPLVWTLQDMWSFTGGCHYSEDCDRYQKNCGNCPQLKMSSETDLSRWVWQRKAKAWENLNLTIVTPSEWMGKCARSSSLFKNLRVEVVPFCLDTKIYQPSDKKAVRDRLNLPQDKLLVLFGALSATQDKRKGFQLLIPALQRLSQMGLGDRIELVVFGSSRGDNAIELGFNTHYLGHIENNDKLLAEIYSAADVMIVPSLAESFGQTASESLACGTPVVAFRATGLKDIIDHQSNGYLVTPFEVEDLGNGIAWTLEDRERHQQLCVNARKKAIQAFSLEIQARRYVALYEELLSNENSDNFPVVKQSNYAQSL
jgi:glycosyltransferase involved in cell wall biosynthesis